METADDIMRAFSNSEESYADNVIIGVENNEKLQYSLTYDVAIPKPNNKVVLDISAINKALLICRHAKKKRFPFAEVFLGAASLFIGAFFGALVSKVPYEASLASILSYNVFTVLGVGFAVAYVFCRDKESNDAVQLATKIEDCFSDFDINESEGQSNEHK